MAEDNNLTILQMNDSHGYFEIHPEYYWKDGNRITRKAGGYARISSYFEKIREENPGSVLVLDNGDTIHGTFPAVNSKGKDLIPILNELDFDAWTAHWEFAYGPEHLKKLVEEINYPMLAINCFDESTDELIFDPYRIVRKGGLKIGVIGIANTIVDKTMPEHFSEGVYLTLGNEELPKYIRELRDKKDVDLIVVVSHLGFPHEVKLSKETDGIDVMLSGHTHNRLYEAKEINDTIIIQSGYQGSFIGRLDLKVNENGIKSYDHELVDIDESIEPDDRVKNLVDQALEPHREMLEEKVGRTELTLARDRTLETTMDNLLLKALIDVSEAEMAFSNGWRYGAPIPPGPIRMNDLWNIIPTNPPVSVCDIKGEEIWEMMEENFEKTFSSDPYGQMGGYVKRCYGINVYFKAENPEGMRIQELFVGDQRLKRDKTYHACFVTTQGIPSKYGENRRNLDIDAITALKEYIEDKDPVKPNLEGSIVAI